MNLSKYFFLHVIYILGSPEFFPTVSKSFDPFPLGLTLGTWFIISGSLKPRIPAFFGLQIFDHLIRTHFISPFAPDQRKFLWMALTFLRTILEVAKAWKIYREIACRTNLRRMIRLGRFKTQKFQEDSHFSKEERRSSHELFLRALSIIGISRCFEGRTL